MTPARGGATAPDEPLQLSLLHGFPASAATAGPALAAELPVARVLLESSLPHLDRPFDYSVPAELDAAARPGVRVRVKFSGQELGGYLLERTAASDAGHPLVPLFKVVSPVPVLTPAVAELAGRVAARYAGTVSDVLRVAVPPRMAKLEKEFAPGGLLDAALFSSGSAAGDGAAAAPEAPAPSGWADYHNGPAFLQHLGAGESPRAALSALQGFGPGGWPRVIAEAVAAVRRSGRGRGQAHRRRRTNPPVPQLPAGAQRRSRGRGGDTLRRVRPGPQAGTGGLLGRRRRPAHRAAVPVCPRPRSPAAPCSARRSRLPPRGPCAQHRDATAGGIRLGPPGRGGSDRGAPHRAARPQHRRQFRAGA